MSGITSRAVLAIDPNSCDDECLWWTFWRCAYCTTVSDTEHGVGESKKKKKKMMTSRSTVVTVAGSARHTQAGVLNDISDSRYHDVVLLLQS